MAHSNCESFTGPVFIIGMPRSGTKLLRDLLNNHPLVGIPTIETNFLPQWVKEWHRYRNLPDASEFQRFYRWALHFSYFKYMREDGCLITEKEWYAWCRNFTPGGVFEALIRHDTNAPYDSGRIWGDKSPPYINCLMLLKGLFPSARFIHIVRDVRDYCLSIRKTWGKNMIRAAQRWSDDVCEARRSGREFGKDYMEVNYEGLIGDTSATLREVCAFLEIEFYADLSNLRRATENLGEAKGLTVIKRDNKEKYLSLLDEGTQRKIEGIAAEVLKEHGYAVGYPGKAQRISALKMAFYKMSDACNLVRFYVRERGLWGFIRWTTGFPFQARK